jgi:hypothetical protein
MTAPTIDEDRSEVRRLLLEGDRRLRSGDPDAKAANQLTAEVETIAERRDAENLLLDLLSPLLTDDADSVRFGAASFLLSRGHADLAVPVLEKVSDLRAMMVLDIWRSRQV